MNVMMPLLPFQTLDQALRILNQINQEIGRTVSYSTYDFLAWALNGNVNLTVMLPSDFHVAQKNSKKMDTLSSQLTLRKGLVFFFASSSTIFSLSLGQPSTLDSVFNISDDDGSRNTYYSVKPYMTVSIDDLRISGDQLFRLIKHVFPYKDKTSISQNAISNSSSDTSNEISGFDNNPTDTAFSSQVKLIGPTKESFPERISIRESQIRAILAQIESEEYDVLNIPDGGKTKLRRICKSLVPSLFPSDHPFNDAWNAALHEDPPRLRMANHKKFGGK